MRRMGLSFSALALTLVSVSLAVAGPALVATSSNESSGNRLLIFEVAADGSLAGPESVTTGGSGTGAGLGSQGALALSRGGRWLLVVNAGSDNVSLFEVTASGPVLRDVVPSGGRNPISVAIAGRSVAVLNAGGAVGGRDNITGFVIGRRGQLVRVKGATRPLSEANVGPAQVAFALDGAVAVVTEKATNRIDTFALDAQGAMSGPRVHASAGPTPFGFDVVFGEFLVVSEAAGGAPGASSVSSYHVQGDGGLVPLTSALATGQSAACWTEVTRDGRFGYLTNAASSNVTGLALSRRGELSLQDPSGVAGGTGAGSAPIDVALSPDQRLLFVLSQGTNTISSFAAGDDGQLAPAGTAEGLPASAAGLIAY